MKIYTDQHKVERGGKIINLTHTEFEILVLLASNPGRAFSKEEMYLKIWNEPYYGNERVLNSHMNRLRGKLLIIVIRWIIFKLYGELVIKWRNKYGIYKHYNYGLRHYMGRNAKAKNLSIRERT